MKKGGILPAAADGYLNARQHGRRLRGGRKATTGAPRPSYAQLPGCWTKCLTVTSWRPPCHSYDVHVATQPLHCGHEDEMLMSPLQGSIPAPTDPGLLAAYGSSGTDTGVQDEASPR